MATKHISANKFDEVRKEIETILPKSPVESDLICSAQVYSRDLSPQ